jgi:hypothetical protein
MYPWRKAGEGGIMGNRLASVSLIALCALLWAADARTAEQKLLPTGGDSYDRFGWCVAIAGDYAVVGTPQDEIGGDPNVGSAYIFYESGGTWTQQAKLTAGDGEPGDLFGSSVAISGDYVIVGAPEEDSGGTGAGAVYVFHRSGASWTQEDKLTADDNWPAYDHFGTSVSICSFAGDEYAIIGAPNDGDAAPDRGAAFVFVRNGASWTQEQKIAAWDGAEGDQFGTSVCLFGLTTFAIVGSPYDDVGGSNDQGSAYIYSRSGSNWSLHGQVTAGNAGDRFGTSVAMSAFGTPILVGAPQADGGGAAYVFQYGASWTQQAVLTALDGVAWDHFGRSVALSTTGDMAVAGAHGDDPCGDASGSAYAFEKDGSSWDEIGKRIPTDGSEGDIFGHSVSIYTGDVIIGAPQDGPNGTFSGSAYVYEWDDMDDLVPMTMAVLRLSDIWARLSWEPVPGASAYYLYRSATPYFDPGAASPWRTVQPPATYTDFADGVGNPSTNYFFAGKAYNAGQMSPNSNIVGEFDFGTSSVVARTTPGHPAEERVR